MSNEQRQKIRDGKEERREIRVAEAIARQRAEPLDTEDFQRFKPEVAEAVAIVTKMTKEELIIAIDSEIERATSQP